METIGWILWAVLLIFTISLFYGTVKTFFLGTSVTYSTVLQTISFVVILLVFLLKPELNKINLIWISPLVFFLIAFIVPWVVEHR